MAAMYWTRGLRPSTRVMEPGFGLMHPAVYTFFLLLHATSFAMSPKQDMWVSEPWMRESLPGSAVTSGYFTLHNQTARTRRLIGAESKAASKVALHTHIRDSDMMRMRPISSVNLPADGSLVFAPGSLHLMFFGLEEQLHLGDNVQVTLLFADGERLSINFPVRARGGN